MVDQMPKHYGMKLTPTFHSSIYPAIDPEKHKLSTPHVVVVTGAGKGLGYHVSLNYARAGASGISISSRTQKDLDKLTEEIKSIDPKIEILSTITDTQSDKSVEELAEAVKQKWGRVDTVVANAGIISKYVESKSRSNLPVGIIEDNDWARVLDINLLGSWRIAKAFMPLLVATKDGLQTLIVNTSLAAHSMNSFLTPIAYNVSKIAVNRLVEHIAADHEKDGILAFALHPGAVLTPQTEGHVNGDVWAQVLHDDVGLAGAWSVWLSRERRAWLSGRYASCNWDVEELEKMKDDIVTKDLLKFRMGIPE
ncbi:hypothetical protein BDV96DRAFT_610501 [Lophiotrema nucula]|uniref:NAD(P)-binding protein n=1 Tax=Lophiotrema nucula TaxID=690887 RepID=A0A6A5ZIZ9_9PLEO|nr:hypothetical protein BDV96DRAFT_610501 [Lophiotrema nucula]